MKPTDKLVNLMQNTRHNFTVRQLALLGDICSSPFHHSTKYYAERLNISIPAISKACNTLESFGLLKRLFDSEDRRKIKIIPTDKGKQMIHQLFN